MNLVIDSNMYWLPECLFTDRKIRDAFLRAVPQYYATRAYEESEGSYGKPSDHLIIERPVGYPSLNYNKYDYSLERQINALDEANITVGLLKLPGCQEWLTLELCKLFNTKVSEHIAQSKGRLKALAVVPPYADDEVFEELERSIYDLGLSGIQLSAHYGNLYLDDLLFRPFFKRVNEMNIPVYVHHTPVPVEYQTIYQYDNLRRSLGRCMDQSIAIGREIFSDMFEELPNLILIHSMLGGGIHTFTDSLFPGNSAGGRFNTDAERYKKYFTNHIYLEMSHAQSWGKSNLEAAITSLGSTRVLYGSSYPVKKEWFLHGSSFIEALNISKKEKENILGENTKRLYRLNL